MKLDKKRLTAMLRSEYALKQRLDKMTFEEEVVLPAVAKLEELDSYGINIDSKGVKLTDVSTWLDQADKAITAKREELRLQIEADNAEATEREVEEAKAMLKALEAKARKAKGKTRKAA